jgi:hypothetical protein
MTLPDERMVEALGDWAVERYGYVPNPSIVHLREGAEKILAALDREALIKAAASAINRERRYSGSIEVARNPALLAEAALRAVGLIP